jgi:hypothetical protein
MARLSRYRPGRLVVLDREWLEVASCECYGTLRRQYAQVLGDRPAAG